MVNDILSAFMHWKSLFKSDLETYSESEKHWVVSQSINKYLLVPLALNTRNPGSAPGVRPTACSEFLLLALVFRAHRPPCLHRGLRGEGGRQESGGTTQSSVPAAASQVNTLPQGAFYRQRVPREEDGPNTDPAIPKISSGWNMLF